MKDLAKIHQKHPGKTKITIIEACPTLLNGSNNWFQQKALERLKKLNVEVLLNSKITSVSDKKVILEDNSEVDFDVLIWTAGVKANPLVSKIDGVSLAKNQCFAVDKYLRILGFENVFALGDNTYCFSSEKACIVPPTAQAAIEQGKITGKNIVRLLENKPLFEYSAKLPSFVVPLGEGFALAEIWGMKVSGILGWWLKRLITLRYLSSILPFSTAVKLWYQGVKFFI